MHVMVLSDAMRIGCTAIALMQISAYSTHKNIAIRKIMEAMCTVYAKNRDSVSTRLKQHMTQMITEYMLVCERKAHIVCKEHFILLNLKGGFEMQHSFLYFFWWYTFLNFVRKFLAHLPVYGVRIS